jgi:hypothetical protein
MAIEELEAAAPSLTIGIDTGLGLRNPRRGKPLIKAEELPSSFTDTARTAESCSGSTRAIVSTDSLAGGTPEIDPSTIAPGLKASKASAKDIPSKCIFLASQAFQKYFRNGLESDSTGEDRRNLFPNSAAPEREGTGDVPSDLVGATKGAEEKPKTTGEIPSNLEEATGGKENLATGDANPEDADPKVTGSSEENENFFKTTSGAGTTEGMEEECSTNAGKVGVETPTASGTTTQIQRRDPPRNRLRSRFSSPLGTGLKHLSPILNPGPFNSCLAPFKHLARHKTQPVFKPNRGLKAHSLRRPTIKFYSS